MIEVSTNSFEPFWLEAQTVWGIQYSWYTHDITSGHTETMTKISAIVCTVQLRHKSKQKYTEAQQCIIPPGFP